MCCIDDVFGRLGIEGMEWIGWMRGMRGMRGDGSGEEKGGEEGGIGYGMVRIKSICVLYG